MSLMAGIWASRGGTEKKKEKEKKKKEKFPLCVKV